MIESRFDENGEKILFVHNVAVRCGVAERTVRWWVETKRLRAVRVGRRAWGILESEIESFEVQRPLHGDGAGV